MTKVTNNNLIVIAEDSLTQAEQLKYTLEEAGYRVLHGINGKKAFSLVKKEKPLLLISDIVMPVMDGYELCKKVKTDTDLENIPVMLLTTLSDPSDIIKGLESKADNFITKPYKDKDLLSRVRNIIINQELRKDQLSEMGLDILFAGKKHRITSNRLQILDLLISLFENFKQKNIELNEVNKELVAIQKELEYLNKNLEKEVETRIQKITRLNSLLEAIRDINQLIVKEKNPDRLLQIACMNLVKVRNYKYAWIMKLDEKGKVAFAVHDGLGNEFQALEKYLKKGRWPVCCQKAMKQSEIVIMKSLQTECLDCPLVKVKPDMISLIIQIRYGNRIYGILVIYTSLESSMNEEENSLLHEVAGDLGFALHNIELAEKHRKANIELKKRTHDLNERVKELNCLYSIDEITTIPGVTNDEVFGETLDIIQKSWQYPGITCVKIRHDKDIFKTGNFEKTKWVLKTDLIVDNKVTGEIEVCYLEKTPYSYQGPFLEEEIHILQGIANNLVKYIKRKEIQNELIIAKEKAEESDKLKSAFLMNMSHEIRTPMNAIIGFSELLSDPEIKNEQKKEFITIIQDNGARLLLLINDIIDISKVESGSLSIELQAISIPQLLSDLLFTFEKEKEKLSKVEVELRVTPDLMERDLVVKTDPFRIRQILSNLLNNALKYTEKGMIEFGYSITDNRNHERDEKNNIDSSLIRFYVKDTGIGIHEEKTELIFDRFMKVENKTKLYDGAGLGLTLSKELIYLLGGEIWVESVPGQGSTFYFTLPYEKSAGQSQGGSLKEIAPEKIEWSDKIIMVAEDEESNFQLIDYILQKTNIKIFWVKNGVEAVDFCKSNKDLDLILMDIKMPEMDGLTATRLIKEINKNLPVIALTAFASENDRNDSLKAGCSDYMPKPIVPDELMLLMNKYLKKDK